MRKLLLGATALTAVAAIQTANAAEIADGLTLGATVRMEILLSADDNGTGKKMGFKDTSTEVNLDYTTQTDDGYTLAVHYQIGRDDAHAAGVADGYSDDEASVSITTGETTIMFGQNDGAIDQTKVGIPSVGTGLADGNAAGYTSVAPAILLQAADSGDAAKVMLVQGLGPITAAVSYAPTAGERAPDLTDTDAAGDGYIEAGVNYSMDMSGMTITASGSFASAEGVSAFGAAAQVETMGLTGAVGFVSDSENDTSGFWVGGTYALAGVVMGNDLTVGANYASSEDNSVMAFGAGTTLMAGVGASLEYASLENAADADGSVVLARLTAGF